MASATKRQIDIIVSAKDEASGVFSKVAHSAKALNLEARQSGEGALEKLLKGGGALGLAHFALDATAKAAEGASHALNEYANNQLTAGEALGHFLQESSAAIPVLGDFVKAFGEIGDGLEDFAHYMNGDGQKSAGTALKESEAFNRLADSARKALAEEGAALEAISGDKYAKAAHKIAEEYEKAGEAVRKMRAEAAKLPDEDRRKIEPSISAADAAREKVRTAALEKLSRDTDEERFKSAAGVQERISALRTKSEENDLREAGLSALAEMRAIRESAARDIKSAIDRAQEADKSDPANQGQADELAFKEYRAIVTHEAIEVERIKREKRFQDQEEERDHQAKVGDILTKGAELRLRLTGDALGAERQSLRDNFDRQSEDIDRRTSLQVDKLKKSETKEAQERIATLQRRAREEKDALRDDYGLQQRKLTQDNLLRPSDFKGPQAVESRTLTGRGQANTEQQMLELARQQAELLKNMFDRIDKGANSADSIDKQLKNATPGTPIFANA